MRFTRPFLLNRCRSSMEAADELGALARLVVAALADSHTTWRRKRHVHAVVDSDCAYQRELLRSAALNRADWLTRVEPSTNDVDVQVWIDEYERIPWEIVLSPPRGTFFGGA